VLHAIARSKLDEFQAAGDGDRSLLHAGLMEAWGDLEAAVANLDP
jgi:hypothetical protein